MRLISLVLTSMTAFAAAPVDLECRPHFVSSSSQQEKWIDIQRSVLIKGTRSQFGYMAYPDFDYYFPRPSYIYRLINGPYKNAPRGHSLLIGRLVKVNYLMADGSPKEVTGRVTHVRGDLYSGGLDHLTLLVDKDKLVTTGTVMRLRVADESSEYDLFKLLYTNHGLQKLQFSSDLNQKIYVIFHEKDGRMRLESGIGRAVERFWSLESFLGIFHDDGQYMEIPWRRVDAIYAQGETGEGK